MRRFRTSDRARRRLQSQVIQLDQATAVQLTASIFKAYDIRGVVPATVNEEIAEGLGRAFGTQAARAGERSVAVGRDGRLSGASLAAALIRGLVATGVEVIDVGVVTTPMLYFAAHTLCQSGIQITGSHNPKDYNGFKMVLAGRAIFGDEIQALRSLMETDAWSLSGGGSVRHVDVLGAYRERILGDVKLARPMKLVIDSGNGVAGASAPGIFRALGCVTSAAEVIVPGIFDVKWNGHALSQLQAIPPPAVCATRCCWWCTATEGSRRGRSALRRRRLPAWLRESRTG